MLRVVLAVVAAVLVWAAPAVAAGPDVVGRWDRLPPVPAGFNAPHLVVGPSGKVLLIAGSGRNRANFEAGSFRSFVWEPGAARAWRPVVTPKDMFCAGHVLLPDGRALVVGGTTAYGPPFQGSRAVYAFNFQTERYDELGPMEVPRWYPSAVEMADGRVVVASGNGLRQDVQTLAEVFDWRTDRMSRLPGARYFPIYPFMVLAGSGELFYSGAAFGRTGDPPPGFWNPSTDGYRPVGAIPRQGHRRFASACWVGGDVRRQQLMVMGGQGEAGTATIDLGAPSPRYVVGPPLRDGKSYLNCSPLPDGSVLEAGGGKTNTIAGASREVGLLRDPAGPWQAMAPLPAGEHRVYHSLLCVLNSGAVLSVTSNPGSDDSSGRDQSHSMLLYRPPYLFRGPRPRVTAGPTQVRYGQRYRFAATGGVDHFAVDRPPSVTHSQDPNQRPLRLELAPDGTVRIPAARTMMPPGWYRLWAVNARGVPSAAWPFRVS